MSQLFTSYLAKVKISPRKARLVADLVRGMNVQDALDALKFTKKRTAPILSKMIYAAVSNASQKATVDTDLLVVKEVYVNEGPTEKRFLPRAQGRATPIRKRSSHITVKLSEY